MRVAVVISLGAAILVGTACAPAASAGEAALFGPLDDINGFLRIRAYGDADGGSDPEYVGEWRLELPLRFSESATARISAETRLDYGVTYATESDARRLDLREAYLDSEWSAFRIRYGRQFLRWGKGDEVNPVDNFTPEDLREALNLDRADRKIPAWAICPKVYLGDVRWETVYQPVFAPNRLGATGERWEPFVVRNYRAMGFPILSDDPPDRVFADSVWATRVVFQSAFGDLSASYAYHFEENPAYRVVPNPEYRPDVLVPPAFVQPTYERVHSVGTDFETAAHGWTFREETVFTTDRPYVTYDRADPDAVVQKDTITCLIGCDYTYRSDNYINLQLIQEFILDHEPQMQPDDYEASLTFRFWRCFLRQKLKVQVTGRYYLTESDYFWKANLEYEFNDNLKLDAGYMDFGGDDTGLFGQFDANDQVYALTKYAF